MINKRYFSITAAVTGRAVRNNLLFSALASLLAAGAVQPARAYTDAFLPENNLNIPVSSDKSLSFQQEHFNAVLDVADRLFRPIIAARGGELRIERNWTDGKVNAYARREGNTYVVATFGGLARHQAVTGDGFALVVCHELGHHLGGIPVKTGRWASSEGQADYYATMKCLKMVYADPASDRFATEPGEGGSDEIAGRSCGGVYARPAEREICLRSALAGNSVAKLFKDLGEEPVAPSYSTPDTNVVPETNVDKYPGTQCRLDTYLQGALCSQPVTVAPSYTDTAVGSCTRGGGFKTGFRPLCWYKPSNAEEMLPPGAGLTAPSMNGDMIPGRGFSTLRTGMWGAVIR